MLGIFDSGVGGLSVVRELLRRKPHVPFLYLGDTARTPYGNKSPETICRYAKEDVYFLIEQGATAIVIACNTISSVASEHLRAVFPTIRFFDVITPAVRYVASPQQSSLRIIGVIGTRATIRSGVYERMLKAAAPTKFVLSVECPLFVPLVEEHWIDRPETKRIVRASLQPLRQKQVDALILGCTHYPFLAHVIHAALQRRVRIIDSPSCVLHDMLEMSPELFSETERARQRFFFTDITEQRMSLVRRWVGQNAEIQKANLTGD